MNDSCNIMEKNLEKWKTLPAGGHRKKITELMEMADNELLDFYKECIYFLGERKRVGI